MIQASQAEASQLQVLKTDVRMPKQVRLVICGLQDGGGHGSRHLQSAYLTGGAAAHNHQCHWQPTAPQGRRASAAANRSRGWLTLVNGNAPLASPLKVPFSLHDQRSCVAS